MIIQLVSLLVLAVPRDALARVVRVATSPDLSEKVAARDLLNRNPVQLEHRGRYNRALFSGWTDNRGDGCDTRAEKFAQGRDANFSSVVDRLPVQMLGSVTGDEDRRIVADGHGSVHCAMDRQGRLRGVRGARGEYVKDARRSLLLPPLLAGEEAWDVAVLGR